MPTELLPVWNQVEWLHSSGMSLIPVRDKDEGDFLAKMPYRGWKEYQSRQIQLTDLWGQMEFHETAAIAIIAGKVSGNLEIIDIDVKYKPGIDATILSDIKSLYPDLYTKLRIHKTPSGGYHILYRIPNDTTKLVPGNQKLAGRGATEAELLANPKSKTKNFVETRGEGGYAVAPPSLNYTVHQDCPIPVISWEDRCSIINICRSQSEIIDVVKPYKPTVSDNGYYNENPFEHYNGSPEGESVLIQHGWSLYKKSSNLFVWFTHPESKKGGIHASFNKAKRVFYIFTSSTQLEESKGYNPSTILAILSFNSDKKKTYQALVQKGYGKIKENIEQKLVKNKAHSGRPLPPNVSSSAKIQYATELVQLQTTYPYGIFWEYDEDSNLVISRERLYIVAEGLGYRLHGADAVQITGYIVKRLTERQFFDGIKSYIKEEDAEEYIKIANCFESFIQRNGSFTITRLPFLDEAAIVKDTSNSSYKFYNNGYLFITGQAISFHTYDNLSGLIWFDDILTRQYQSGPPTGKYVDFIKLATLYEDQADHIHKVIGYLSHQFKDETTGYIIVFTETCSDPKMGGGSGKNILSSLFAHTTTYRSIPGSQVRYDEKFLQAWNRERIFAVSDVPKKFDYSFLKELSTGSGILKKLFKDEVSVNVADMPKFIIQTQFSYEVSDGGLRRRLISVEFTDHFTKSGGVDVYFGCHFPKGWDITDWTGYDNFIASCIKDWLAGGLKLHNPALTEGGWQKQFEQTWGQTILGIVQENIDRWIKTKWITNDNFRNDIDDFFRENNTPLSYRPAMNRIYQGISEYCNHHNFQFLNNVIHRNEFAQPVKHKWFGGSEDTPI